MSRSQITPQSTDILVPTVPQNFSRHVTPSTNPTKNALESIRCAINIPAATNGTDSSTKPNSERRLNHKRINDRSNSDNQGRVRTTTTERTTHKAEVLIDEQVAERLQSQFARDYLRRSKRELNSSDAGVFEHTGHSIPAATANPVVPQIELRGRARQPRRRSSGSVDFLPSRLDGGDWHKSRQIRSQSHRHIKGPSHRPFESVADTTTAPSSRRQQPKDHPRQSQQRQLRHRSAGFFETTPGECPEQQPSLSPLASQQSQRPPRSSGCIDAIPPSELEVDIEHSREKDPRRSASHRIVTKTHLEGLSPTETEPADNRAGASLLKQQSSRLLRNGTKRTTTLQSRSCHGSYRPSRLDNAQSTMAHHHHNGSKGTSHHRAHDQFDRNGSHHGTSSSAGRAATRRTSSPTPSRSRNTSPVPHHGNESGLKIKGTNNLVYQVPLRRNDDVAADSGRRSPTPSHQRPHHLSQPPLRSRGSDENPNSRVPASHASPKSGSSPQSRTLTPPRTTSIRPDTPAARTTTTIQTTAAVAPTPPPSQVKRNTVLTKEESIRLDEEYARQIQQQLTDEDMARRLEAQERVAAAAAASSHRPPSDQTRNNNNGAIPDVVACVSREGQHLGGNSRHLPPLSANHAHAHHKGPARAMAKPSVNHVKSEACCQQVMSKAFSLAVCLGLVLICAVILYVVLTGNDVDIPGTDISVQDITDVFMHDPWEYGSGTEQEQTYWKTSGNRGLTLKVFNALTPDWYPYFYTAVDDWDNGSPDALTLTTQEISYDPNCEAIGGSMKVCNGNYGETGWKGINEVLITAAGVITVSVAKMNEFYLNDKTSTADKQYTMCHEMGHGFGLNHADENFNNRDLGTCMDYTNRPANNMTPNEGSYQILASLYGLANGGVYTPPTTSSSSSAAVPASYTTASAEEQQTSDKKKNKDKTRIRGRRDLAHSMIERNVDPVFDEDNDYHPKNHGRLLKPSFGSRHHSFVKDEKRNLVTSSTDLTDSEVDNHQSPWKLVHRQRGREIHMRELDHGFRVLAHVLLPENEVENQ